MFQKMFLNVSKCLLFCERESRFLKNFLKIKNKKEVFSVFYPNQDPLKNPSKIINMFSFKEK